MKKPQFSRTCSKYQENNKTNLRMKMIKEEKRSSAKLKTDRLSLTSFSGSGAYKSLIKSIAAA